MEQSRPRRWVTTQDFALLVIMLAGYVLTIFVPRRWDKQWIEFLQRRWLSRRAHRVQHLATIIEATLPDIDAAESVRVARRHHRLLLEVWWGRFRSVGPRGWRPEIEIRGRQYLDAALKRGRGAVVWRTRLCDGCGLLQALWSNELAAILLSNEGHGSPDRSRLGVRWSARLYRRAEDRYLQERVQIPANGTLGYMRRLLDRLENNCILVITGENQARQNIDGVVLGRPVSFASGAPSLVQRTAAELLTAYVIRLGTFRYRVVIEPPIQVDRQLDRKDFIRECVAVFCERLEAQIKTYPADWCAWQREDSTIPIKPPSGGESA